jgi:hypothetical protein
LVRIGGIAEVCRIILDGDLAPRALSRDECGLAGVLISTDDILSAERQRAGYGLSYVEAARRAGLHPECARLLIKHGLLEGKLLPSGQWAVPEGAVEAFRSGYVTSTEIAKRLGSRTRDVNEQLRRSGIRPVISPAQVKNFRVAIYRRKEVSNIAFSHSYPPRIGAAAATTAHRRR